MSTTTETLSGIQEQIIADTTAVFRTTSELFSAVYTENAGDALTVRFTVRDVPAAAEAQSAELADVTPTVITIGEVQAKLETVPVLARVSKISIAAPGASMKIAEALAGSLARSMDTAVASVAFTNSIGDVDDSFFFRSVI